MWGKYLNSLELVGYLLKGHYRIAPFNERYEQEASRKLVFSKLYEASKQTKKIHGYLNMGIHEKAKYLMEEHVILLNNLF